MWILRILGPIKISNGPLKFGNLHVFEWDMGHWPILRALHHFWLGLTLALDTIFLELRLDDKVTVTPKQNATLLDPKMYPHTKFVIPTSNNIGGMPRTQFFRTALIGEGQ